MKHINLWRGMIGLAVVGLTSAVAYGFHIRLAKAVNTGSIQLVSASSQYLTSSTAGFPSGSSARTLEAWVKLPSYQDEEILIYGDRSTSNTWEWQISNQGKQVVGDYGQSVASGGSLSVGVWTHIAVSYDGTTVRFYRDGQEDGTATFSNSPNTTTSTNSTNYIGINSDGASYLFNGYIDDLRVWNTARTQSEISGNRFQELTGDEAGLVSYWKVNNSLSDTTTKGNNLTAYNSPSYSSDVHGLTLAFYKSISKSVTSNTTTQPDGELTLTLQANKTYIIDGALFVTSTNATPDLKFDLAATSASALVVGYIASDGSSQGQSGGVLTGSRSTGVVSVGANAPIPVHLTGTTIMSGTNGDLVLEWAQNTSNGSAVTLMRGSYLRAQELP